MPIGNVIAKIRHFRGHGLHSPFIYGLKREGFMKKHMQGENNLLFNALTSNGIEKKIAKELQNVHNYCNLSDFKIVDSNNVEEPASPDVFYILGKNGTESQLEKLLNSGEKVSAAILNSKLARRINAANITIERSRYALVFKDAGLPVQTFKL